MARPLPSALVRLLPWCALFLFSCDLLTPSSTGQRAVWAWGDDEWGQLGNGSQVGGPVPVRVLAGQVAELAASRSYSMARTADGGVLAWGMLPEAPVEASSPCVDTEFAIHTRCLLVPTPAPFPAALGLTGPSLGAGRSALFVGLGAEVWSWGGGAAAPAPVSIPGRLNGLASVGAASWLVALEAGPPNLRAWTLEGGSPHVVAVPATPVGIYVGQEFTVVLDVDGAVWTHGRNERGQLGRATTGQCSFSACDSTPGRVTFPVPANAGSRVQDIAAGDTFALALDTQGRVWAWGDDSASQLGVPLSSGLDWSQVPVLLAFPPGEVVSQVAAGGASAFAVTTSGKVYGWGSNTWGALAIAGPDGGVGNPSISSPVELTAFSGKRVRQLAIGQRHGLALVEE